jgi:hypothetical protein
MYILKPLIIPIKAYSKITSLSFSEGVVCLFDCSDEISVSGYLILDGLLSVFVFPTLIMGWTKRIGGCVGDQEKVGSGSFWISVLVLRVLFTASGKPVFPINLPKLL